MKCFTQCFRVILRTWSFSDKMPRENHEVKTSAASAARKAPYVRSKNHFNDK
jgi:hypothetical protein